MKRRGVIAYTVVIVVGVSLIGPTGANARHVRRRKCGPAAAVTLRRDRRARVFELPAEGPGRDQPTYGCLFSTRHWWRLDRSSRWSYLNSETLVLRAPWVAYSITSMGVDGGGSGISIRNLRTGSETQSYAAVTRPSNPAPETFSSVAKIVLREDGDVAWIGQEKSIIQAQPQRLQVELGDSAGVSVLDESPSIDPESLSLNGSILTWSDSGATRTAELP